MSPSRRTSGFSLIEVVVAVAVIALGIVVILSLLPALLRQRSDAETMHTALGLAPAITSKLTDLSSGNINNIGSQLAPFGGDATNMLCFVAQKDGTELQSRQSAGPNSSNQYFLVELFQYPAGSSLAYQPSSTALAISVRVSWPYRIKAGTDMIEIPIAERQSVVFSIAINP